MLHTWFGHVGKQGPSGKMNLSAGSSRYRPNSVPAAAFCLVGVAFPEASPFWGSDSIPGGLKGIPALSTTLPHVLPAPLSLFSGEQEVHMGGP